MSACFDLTFMRFKMNDFVFNGYANKHKEFYTKRSFSNTNYVSKNAWRCIVRVHFLAFPWNGKAKKILVKWISWFKLLMTGTCYFVIILVSMHSKSSNPDKQGWPAAINKKTMHVVQNFAGVSECENVLTEAIFADWTWCSACSWLVFCIQHSWWSRRRIGTTKTI